MSEFGEKRLPIPVAVLLEDREFVSSETEFETISESDAISV